jgi:hypothetical protein
MSYANYGILIRCYVDQATTKVGSNCPRSCTHVRILRFLHYGDAGRFCFIADKQPKKSMHVIGAFSKILVIIFP